MHGRPRGTRHETTPGAGPVPGRQDPTGAVTWIDRTCAIVARTTAEGGISVARIDAGGGALGPFLGRVAGAIGDRERVQVLGSDAMRIELEREYVAIYRRPERLLDVPSDGPGDEAELVGRLKALTGR